MVIRVHSSPQILAKKLLPDQLHIFLEQLLTGLLDRQEHSASGACVVFNSVVKSRGGELHNEVN